MQILFSLRWNVNTALDIISGNETHPFCCEVELLSPYANIWTLSRIIKTLMNYVGTSWSKVIKPAVGSHHRHPAHLRWGRKEQNCPRRWRQKLWEAEIESGRWRDREEGWFCASFVHSVLCNKSSVGSRWVQAVWVWVIHAEVCVCACVCGQYNTNCWWPDQISHVIVGRIQRNRTNWILSIRLPKVSRLFPVLCVCVFAFVFKWASLNGVNHFYKTVSKPLEMNDASIRVCARVCVCVYSIHVCKQNQRVV